MSGGFHTATICSNCDPPVVAISTGYGSRCPRCGQVDVGGDRRYAELSDGALARRIITDTTFRSDGDARLLAELAQRLLDHAARCGAQCDCRQIAADRGELREE